METLRSLLSRAVPENTDEFLQFSEGHLWKVDDNHCLSVFPKGSVAHICLSLLVCKKGKSLKITLWTLIFLPDA